VVCAASPQPSCLQLTIYDPKSNLIHAQGTGDNFYKQGQLLPENFEAAARDAGINGLNIRYQPDYDHSYYTMASFADDHIEHAAKYLFA
jgi:S-formylglutathione hydrolase FrmB